MKKFWHELMKSVPLLWGFLWVAIITFGSVALFWQIIKWLIELGGAK